MGAAVFISDLHLAPETPDITEGLLRFLDGIRGPAQSLYILGDLFEIWIGDDELTEPLQASVARALKAVSDSGARVAIMHGNRDFLLGPDFMRATGATLLVDPCVIDLFGISTVLMHGDSLCIDDQAYLDFRQQVREPAWQTAFLAQPIEKRRAIARQYRTDSRDAQTEKDPLILDVNAEAVRQAFRASGARRMIHGHTHRPALHRLRVDGIDRQRWVLPDWSAGGGYLRCDARGCVASGLVA